MSEKYFVVHADDDGDVRLEELTREELITRFEPDEDGGLYYGNDNKPMPKLGDTLGGVPYHNFAERGGLVIIKGSIITPRLVKVAVKVEVD